MIEDKVNVLIAGANGTTGKIIVQLLKDSTIYKPIAMVRKEEQQDTFTEQGVSTVLADLEDDVEHSVQNVVKVIFAAGSSGKNVIGVDQEGAKRLIKAAEKAGVNKFVMLSSMGASDPSQNKDMREYMQAKQNADNYLRASNLPFTIVRPGMLTNDNGNGKIDLKKKLRKGKIARNDVAKTLVEALGDNVQTNQTFEIISGNTIIEKAIRNPLA